MKPLKIQKLKSKKKSEGSLKRLSKKKGIKKSNIDTIKRNSKRSKSISSSLEEIKEKLKKNSKTKKMKSMKGKHSSKNEKNGKKSKKSTTNKITKLINTLESSEIEMISKNDTENKIEKKVSFSSLIEKQMNSNINQTGNDTEDEEKNINETEKKTRKGNSGKQTNLINDYPYYLEKNKQIAKDSKQFAIRKHVSVIGMKFPKTNSMSCFSDELFPRAITARPNIMEHKTEEESFLERSSFYDNDSNFKSWMQFNKAQSIVLQNEDMQLANFASNLDIQLNKPRSLTKKKKNLKRSSRRKKLKNKHSTISPFYSDKEAHNRINISLENEHTNKKIGKVKRKKSIIIEKSKSKRNIKTGIKNKKCIRSENISVRTHKKSSSNDSQDKTKHTGKHISLEGKRIIGKDIKDISHEIEIQNIEKQETLQKEKSINGHIPKKISNDITNEKKHETAEETVTERYRKIKSTKNEESLERKEKRKDQIEKDINNDTNETDAINIQTNKQDPTVTEELKELMTDMKKERDKKENKNITEEQKAEIHEINKEAINKKESEENLYNDIKQSFSFAKKKTSDFKKLKEEKKAKEEKKTKEEKGKRKEEKGKRKGKKKEVDNAIVLKKNNTSENELVRDPKQIEVDMILNKYLFAKEKEGKRRKPIYLFDLSINHSEIKVNTIDLFSSVEPATTCNDILFFMDNYRKKQKKYNDIFDFFKNTFKKQYYELEGVQAVLQIFDLLIKKLMTDLGTHSIKPYFTDTLMEKIKNYERDREMEKKLRRNLGKGKFLTLNEKNKYMKEMGLLDVIMGSDIFDIPGVKHIRHKCNEKLYLDKKFNENPVPIFFIKDWHNQEKLAFFKQKLDEVKRRKEIQMLQHSNSENNKHVECCLSGLLSCFKYNCSNSIGFSLPPSKQAYTERFYEHFICNKNENYMEQRCTLSMRDVSYIMAL